MIAKFISSDTETSIEFSSLSSGIIISISTFFDNKAVPAYLSKEELFELIGFLLRVQSELKK